MRKIFIFITVLLMPAIASRGQAPDTVANNYVNSAEMLLKSEGKLGIGGYGEVHYNHPLVKDQKDLGTLDVHRLVLFVGYNFSEKTRFVSEIEFEYATELWIEQAFLQHSINNALNFRAGLLLVPMGIINEHHEPTTFNGVERPVIDTRLGLSTWREVGFGLAGTLLPVSTKYQIYVLGGLNGYDTKAVFTGASGLREGRQKGSKAYVNSPSFSAKIEYFGLRHLNIGVSGYLGKSQSRLYSKLGSDNAEMNMRADSSSVGIAMLGADARYSIKGLEMRIQLYYTAISNTLEYNLFTRSAGKNNDLGSSMLGFYAEAGYNVFRAFENIETELIPFLRYEYVNTHNSVDAISTTNLSYKSVIITGGLTLKLTANAVLKSDVQFIRPGTSDKFNRTLNAGIGYMF